MMGVAVAPALGINGGIILYNLTPEFWDGVAQKLVDIGYTISRKVVYFIDENGTMNVPEDVINTYKDAFLDAGVFPEIPALPDEYFTPTNYISVSEMLGNLYDYTLNYKGAITTQVAFTKSNFIARFIEEFENRTGKDINNMCCVCYISASRTEYEFALGGRVALTEIGTPIYVDEYGTFIVPTGYTIYDVYINLLYRLGHTPPTRAINQINNVPSFLVLEGQEYLRDNEHHLYVFESDPVLKAMISRGFEITTNEYTDPTAIYPNQDPISTTYDGWDETILLPPIGVEVPFIFPTLYPLAYPALEVGVGAYLLPIQFPAQNPLPDPATGTEHVSEDPIIGWPMPIPTPDIDPSAGNPVYIPPIIEDSSRENPVEPDPTVDPSDPITPTTLPSSVSSNKLFTAYNPSDANLDALGGYLWNLNILEDIKKIWQNPLDGLISLIQIYCTPTVGTSQHIILGCLDSEVLAPVITNQFTEIDCGSISLSELNQNVSDYPPYTSLHIYLPFIGITELDVGECMRGTISVKYKVDVFTGTCLAEVKISRSPDLSDGFVLYTFNGNCSQQIPLTSANASGLLSSILSGVGLGLSVATGGGAGVMMGIASANGLINHEMLHVSHSGNIGANSGIMGHKKPYLIIGRARTYNANTYNTKYGYPANKTVYLGNCTGYVRAKAVNLQTYATDAERKEILSLLESGVFM